MFKDPIESRHRIPTSKVEINIVYAPSTLLVQHFKSTATLQLGGMYVILEVKQ